MVIYQQSSPIADNAHQGRFLQSKMAYIENFRGLIVVIDDRTINIGIQGNFKTTITNAWFCPWGAYITIQNGIIETLNFAYYFNLIAWKSLSCFLWYYHSWETYLWYWWKFLNTRWLQKLGFELFCTKLYFYWEHVLFCAYINSKMLFFNNHKLSYFAHLPP